MKKKNNIIIITIITLIAILSAIVIISNNNKKGELKKTSYQEILKMQENKENFVLIVSQSTCSHCLTYKPKVEEIAKEYGIIIYYIDIDTMSNNKDFLKEFNLTGATPMTLFFIKGKETSVLNRIEGDATENSIKEKLKKMDFID